MKISQLLAALNREFRAAVPRHIIYSMVNTGAINPIRDPNDHLIFSDEDYQAIRKYLKQPIVQRYKNG